MKIEVFSDVACPWCYIGKRRFESALEGFEHRQDVEIEWKSYELSPEMETSSPLSTIDHLVTAKGMPLAQVEAMVANVARTGATVGLDMRFDIAKVFNTRNAHQLLHYAKSVGQQPALAERLFKAKFTEGRQLGDTDVLLEVAAEAGLDAEAARDVLASNTYLQAVIDDEDEARSLGANGVPFFVINRRYGISGAQNPETFAKALQTAWSEEQPLKMVNSGDGADACGPDGCAI